MLRQLARLTRPVPALGPNVLAVSVYADENDQPLAAGQSGYEGVACVDDAARAAVVLDDLANRTGQRMLRDWSEGLIEFVIAAQRPDGTFVNFIADWSGAHNEDGPTSYAGGLFWQARALAALGRGARLGGRFASAYLAARAAIPVRGVPADVRSLHVIEGIEAYARGLDTREDVDRWCDEIAACRAGDLLLDSYGAAPHLWGHLQEAALARAGCVLERDDLIALAVRSAEQFVVPAVISRFTGERVQPYDVASAAATLDALYAVTHDRRYAVLASQAREWFETRDADGRTVYDRQRGRVADCVTRAQVNPRSGAEANIVAAEALLEEVARELGSAGDRPMEIAALLATFSPAKAFSA